MKRRQRNINRLGPIMFVGVLLLAAWGVIDRVIGPGWSWDVIPWR